MLTTENFEALSFLISKNAFKIDACKKMVMNLCKVKNIMNIRSSTFSRYIESINLYGLFKGKCNKIIGGEVTCPNPLASQAPRSLRTDCNEAEGKKVRHIHTNVFYP